MGPPGSGKGTQAQLLSQTLGVPHISTDELFRQHISDHSELGRLAKTYLDTAELVPSAVTSEMVRHRLTDEAAQPGFLLDGFGRTVEQAIALDEILNEQHHELTAVLDFEIAEDEVVARMLARGRADDTEAVIRTRLRVYREENQPLRDHYAPILPAYREGSRRRG